MVISWKINRLSRKLEHAIKGRPIIREAFLNRKNQLEQQTEQVRERTNEGRFMLLEEERREIPKE